MERCFIKPTDGKRIRLENKQLLPKEGKEVLRTAFIDRRIKDGDVQIVNIDVDNN